jgi:hypothetical protein
MHHIKSLWSLLSYLTSIAYTQLDRRVWKFQQVSKARYRAWGYYSSCHDDRQQHGFKSVWLLRLFCTVSKINNSFERRKKKYNFFVMMIKTTVKLWRLPNVNEEQSKLQTYWKYDNGTMEQKGWRPLGTCEIGHFQQNIVISK